MTEIGFMALYLFLAFFCGWWFGSRVKHKIKDGTYVCQEQCYFTLNYIEYYLKKGTEVKIKNRMKGCSILAEMHRKNGATVKIDTDVSVRKAMCIVGVTYGIC